jgi:hypothetical protein
MNERAVLLTWKEAFIVVGIFVTVVTLAKVILVALVLLGMT